MELRQYLSIARRWAWLLILGLVLGAAGGYFGSNYQTPVYQSATRILVMRPSQGAANSADLSYLNDQQLTQTYLQLLTTQPVLEAASADLGFVIDVKQISVQQIGTTQIIKLTVEDPDSTRAASIANQLVMSLIEQNEKLQSGRYTEAEESLQAQITQVQKQISALELQVNQISVQTVQEQLEAIKAQIDPLQAEVTELQKYIATLSPTTSVTNRTKIAEAKARLDEIEPLLSLYQRIYSDLLVLGKPSDVASSDSARLAQLQSTLELYKQLYINLLSSMETLRLTRLQNTPNVVQIEAAAESELPVRPRPLQNTLLAGAVGLMLAAGIVFLVEYLDNTLKTMEDIERVLQLPVVGYIAEFKHKASSEEDLYVARQPRSPVSEAFRLLRTNLEFMGVDRPIRRVLITSTGPNEGKTTIAVNLAAIIAQGGKRVTIIDADLRRPKMHRFLGLPNQFGLSDLFRGPIAVKSVSQQTTNLKNVSIVTSGSLPPNPTELLASARMDQILHEAERESDIIVLDSPPSLVADVQVLAARVDGVILVVYPGHTLADAALATLEQLRRAEARIIGVVFNRIPRGRSDYYGGYRHYSPYYAGYHYYAGGDERHAGNSTGIRRLFHKLSFNKNGHNGHNGRKETEEDLQDETSIKRQE